MYCFITSADCQFPLLLLGCEQSNEVLMTVLKSPAIITFVESDNNEKLWEKDGLSLLGP